MRRGSGRGHDTNKRHAPRAGGDTSAGRHRQPQVFRSDGQQRRPAHRTPRAGQKLAQTEHPPRRIRTSPCKGRRSGTPLRKRRGDAGEDNKRCRQCHQKNRGSGKGLLHQQQTAGQDGVADAARRILLWFVLPGRQLMLAAGILLACALTQGGRLAVRIAQRPQTEKDGGQEPVHNTGNMQWRRKDVNRSDEWGQAVMESPNRSRRDHGPANEAPASPATPLRLSASVPCPRAGISDGGGVPAR